MKPRVQAALAIIGLVLTIAIFLYQSQTGATKDNQEYIMSLLEEMRRHEVANYETLIQRYPLGYVIFAVDHYENFIPYKSPLREELLIGPNVKITIEEKFIWIRGLILSSGSREFYMANNEFGVHHRVGSRGLVFGTSEYDIWTELIAENRDGVIVLIGVSPFTEP